MKKLISLILFLLLCLFSFNLKIDAATKNNLVNIYFFHSNTCSHCKEENTFLEELKERYSNIRIYKYEIHNENTTEILAKASAIYNINTNGVPITIIGNKVYTGFLYEKSSLKFIKTIEYYSRYGYQDKLGEYLELELPTYEIKETDITLEKFIDNYHNYNLIGLKTDTLNTSTIALILGVLSSFNIIRIITFILILLIIQKTKKELIKILFTASYILLEILLVLVTLINNTVFTSVIYALLLLLLIFTIIKIIKNKKEYFLLTMIIIISFISNYIASMFDNNFIIFHNILDLHHLNGLNIIMYYINYIISNLTITVIILYIGELLLVKLKSIIEQKKKLKSI